MPCLISISLGCDCRGKCNAVRRMPRSVFLVTARHPVARNLLTQATQALLFPYLFTVGSAKLDCDSFPAIGYSSRSFVVLAYASLGALIP